MRRLFGNRNLEKSAGPVHLGGREYIFRVAGERAPSIQEQPAFEQSSWENFPIRQFVQGDEESEMCKKRIERIISKQKECYRIAHFGIYSLILLDQKGMALPEWLDSAFIHGVNYGPSSGGNYFDILESSNVLCSRTERAARTLLDRSLAEKLHDAIFFRSASYRPFLTDWPPLNERGQFISRNAMSPFDYDSLSLETFPIINAERFYTKCGTTYPHSASVLGAKTRPSMATVVLDMIDLVAYFGSIASDIEPQAVSDWLSAFAKSYQLKSISPDDNIDKEWLIRGYLADMFSVVACLNNSPDYRTERERDRSWIDQEKFPGPDLFVEKPPTALATPSEGPLDDLDAAFICSGAFTFLVTKNVREHLQLTHNQEILIYWEDPRGPDDDDFIYYPTPNSWCLYMHRTHKLEKCVPVENRLII